MKRRMEDIGGTCRIESLPGKGTIVRLELPVKSFNTVRAPDPPPGSASPSQAPHETENQPIYDHISSSR
jgi:hypothetical protein